MFNGLKEIVGIELILRVVMELFERWNDDYGSIYLKKPIMELHTGGCSDNEEIVCELEKTFFWFCYWQKSERGGHYYFELPESDGSQLV